MMFFIPGGAVSPEASKKVIDIYSKQLGVPIILLPYPEFIIEKFDINLANYQKYFYSELLKQKDAIVIGFSLGAYFALELASHNELKIEKIFLISPFLKNPDSFTSLFLRRIKNILSYENKGRMFSYSPQEIIKDTLKYRRKFVDQYKNVIKRLELIDNMKSSQTQKILVIGRRDDVIPKLSESDLNMKNSKLYKIDGNHDLITNQHEEVISIIKANKL
jgi:pimeloyl-ACP methyl ester carboxylesterase